MTLTRTLIVGLTVLTLALSTVPAAEAAPPSQTCEKLGIQGCQPNPMYCEEEFQKVCGLLAGGGGGRCIDLTNLRIVSC